MLGLMVAACAQPVVEVPRDVYGAAAKGTLPPEVPKEQQVRYSDDIWKKGVAACLTALGSSAAGFSPAEANRFCGCSVDLMQTRIAAAKLVQIGINSQDGKPPTPQNTPELLPITAACWPK